MWFTASEISYTVGIISGRYLGTNGKCRSWNSPSTIWSDLRGDCLLFNHPTKRDPVPPVTYSNLHTQLTPVTYTNIKHHDENYCNIFNGYFWCWLCCLKTSGTSGKSAWKNIKIEWWLCDVFSNNILILLSIDKVFISINYSINIFHSFSTRRACGTCPGHFLCSRKRSRIRADDLK